MNFRWLAYPSMAFLFFLAGISCKGDGGSAIIDVLATQPEANQADVQVEGRIGFRIDAPIDPATLTSATFFLTDEQGTVVPSTVVVTDAADTAELRPEEPLAVLTTFTATITTELRSTSGGKLEEDYAWSFTTLDSAWGRDEWLEEIGDGVSSSPQIAVDAQLKAIAVWEYEDALGSAIVASRYDRTDLWGVPVDIDDGSGSAVKPRLAMDDAGNGFAVWEQKADDGTTDNVWTNRYDVDDGWGIPELLQDDEATFARSPSVAADPAGNAIAVWVQVDQVDPDTQQRVVWSRRYEPASGWGSAAAIDAMATARAGTSTFVDMDDVGNAIAVWQRPTSGGGVLWANRYAVGAGWGTAELIKDDPDTTALDFRLDVGPNGDAFVVWLQNLDTRDDVWGIRFSGASWDESPTRLDAHDAGDKRTPDVAVDGTVDGAGVAHAVWSQADDDFENVWATTYTPGSSWSVPQLIEPPNDDPRRDSDANSTRVSVNAAGNAFVVWLQRSESWVSVWSNRLDPGTGWIGAEVIEQIEQAARQPQIVVDDARHAHAVWPHSRGNLGGDRLRTNRFE